MFHASSVKAIKGFSLFVLFALFKNFTRIKVKPQKKPPLWVALTFGMVLICPRFCNPMLNQLYLCSPMLNQHCSWPRTSPWEAAPAAECVNKL